MPSSATEKKFSFPVLFTQSIVPNVLKSRLILCLSDPNEALKPSLRAL